jgi:hypothetical protein
MYFNYSRKNKKKRGSSEIKVKKMKVVDRAHLEGMDPNALMVRLKSKIKKATKFFKKMRSLLSQIVIIEAVLTEKVEEKVASF